MSPFQRASLFIVGILFLAFGSGCAGSGGGLRINIDNSHIGNDVARQELLRIDSQQRMAAADAPRPAQPQQAAPQPQPPNDGGPAAPYPAMPGQVPQVDVQAIAALNVDNHSLNQTVVAIGEYVSRFILAGMDLGNADPENARRPWDKAYAEATDKVEDAADEDDALDRVEDELKASKEVLRFLTKVEAALVGPRYAEERQRFGGDIADLKSAIIAQQSELQRVAQLVDYVKSLEGPSGAERFGAIALNVVTGGRGGTAVSTFVGRGAPGYWAGPPVVYQPALLAPVYGSYTRIAGSYGRILPGCGRSYGGYFSHFSGGREIAVGVHVRR